MRLGDLHHLFLVDDDAVGLGQDVLDRRMRRFRFFPVLAPAIVGDAGHRAGAIQSNGGDQILEPVRAHQAQDSRMPWPSIWNTPPASPFASIS